MPQDVDLKTDVIDFLESRLATFNDGVPYLASRQDELLKIKAHFEAMVEYEVTFQEEGAEDGVTIKVYSDAEMTEQVGSNLTTANGGVITADLVNGTYYFQATKASFEEYEGEFTVDSDDITVEFTLVST